MLYTSTQVRNSTAVLKGAGKLGKGGWTFMMMNYLEVLFTLFFEANVEQRLSMSVLSRSTQPHSKPKHNATNHQIL